MPPRRLERHPLTVLDRGAGARFRFDGRAVEGFDGEPLAVALYAHGKRVLSRSMRYHRARGYFCGTGHCTNCFVRLNGTPNARACLEPCARDAWVEGQNAYPSVERDLLAAADVIYPNYLDAHRAFVRPALLGPLFTQVIRGMAGFGRVPANPVPQSYSSAAINADVCVVGSGPAGLAAAGAALEAGRRVLVLERAARPGGRLRILATPFHATAPDAPRTEGKAYAEDATARARSQGADVRLGTRLFGIYPGLRLASASATRLSTITARALVLAPGSYDDYAPMPGADRAGTMLASGALRLLNQHGVLPGEDVAIVGADRDGLLFARDLLACGGRVAAIVDRRLRPPEGPLEADLRRMGIAVSWSTTPLRVVGRRGARGLVVERGRSRTIRCDAVVLSGPRHPALELFQQAGCVLRYEEGSGHRVDAGPDGATSVAGIFAAGSAAGAADPWASVQSGRRAGQAAAAAAGGAA